LAQLPAWSGGSALNLRRVLTHNTQDLKSLAGVLLHLARLDSHVICSQHS